MAVKITVIDNGPLKVEGGCEVADGGGAAFPTSDRTAVFLCRCGRSVNAPFCDGAHAREGFCSTPRAGSDGEA